jgi:hypothetical protein
MIKTSNKIPKASSEQVMEIQYQIGRALLRTPQTVAKRILGNKTAFQKFIQAIAKELEIPMQSEEVIRQLNLIIAFYKEVCDTDVSFILETEKEIVLEGEFQTLGLIISSLSINDMMEAYKEKWKINFFQYSDTGKIEDRQTRPEADFQLFTHRGGETSDKKFLGLSFNQYIAMPETFVNAKEYIAMQGYAKFAPGGDWLDPRGWTKTTSCWSGGKLVGGDWHSDFSTLRLGWDYLRDQDAGKGPRQLVLL